MTGGEFSVFQFFPGGAYEAVASFVDADTAVRIAYNLTVSVGGRIGTTERVIITDGEDFCTFEWKHGAGVVFPPPDPSAPRKPEASEVVPMSQTTMTAWERDPVTRTPAIEDHLGRAWQVQLEAARRARGLGPLTDCSVASWIIEAPWAHPAWHSYVLDLVYLRPNPVHGDLVTKWYLDGATHEIWLQALDPDQPRDAAVELAKIATLSPSNFAAQIIADSDEAAAARIREAVVDICAGRLSPDTDFVRAWAARFGDNMMRQ